MKVPLTTGLVGAGGVNQSFLARLPALLGSLGPVKGSSLRVSRRIANGFKAGAGVDGYFAFRDCGLIWIAVPESMVSTVCADMSRAVPLRGKMVVVCDVLCDSFIASPLQAEGARVATLNCIPDTAEKAFVAEGHRDVLAELRKLLARDCRQLIELHAVSKPLYLSGVFLARHMLFPWICGATESLRAAGFTRDQATSAVQAMGGRALRAYAKAGTKAWNRVEAKRLHREILRDLDAIRFTGPSVAPLYTNQLERLLAGDSTGNKSVRRPAQRETHVIAKVVPV